MGEIRCQWRAPVQRLDFGCICNYLSRLRLVYWGDGARTETGRPAGAVRLSWLHLRWTVGGPAAGQARQPLEDIARPNGPPFLFTGVRGVAASLVAAFARC
jgi:hypothetical protein